MTGSLQLQRYLEERHRLGKPIEEACAISGIGETEAKLTDKDFERGLIELPPHPLNHNQPKEAAMAEGNVAADELRTLIERVERLEEEKKAIADDVKDIYAEAKARGYDAKTMRRIVQLRKMESQAREEAAALLETYANALGMQLAFL